MKKVTVKASTDIALIKYWGKKDEVLRLPENGSISMILDGTDTITTVEFDENLEHDEIVIQGTKIPHGSREARRVVKHLGRIKDLAIQNDLLEENSNISAKIVSQNSFPRGTGLSSSGSGMTALTLAATKALGIDLSEKELSILSRQASGTACRCSSSGYVEWLDGDTSETSYSVSLFPPDHWDLRSVIAVVDEGKKKISSTKGHKTAGSSIFFAERQKRLPEKTKAVKKAIAEKDFSTLGPIIEAEALEFHSILLTSKPPLVMWYPGTIAVMMEVQKMRQEGIEAYFTVNTGFNIHVITLPKYEDEVARRIDALPLVKKTLYAKVGSGPREISEHLF